MNDQETKSKPIPTRHEPEVLDLIERIHAATGVSKAEIIRRAVRYALDCAKRSNSLSFLLGDETAIATALGNDVDQISPDDLLKSVDARLVEIRQAGDELSRTDPVAKAAQMEILELLKPAEAQNTRQHIEEMIRLAGAKKVRDLRTMLDRMADDSTILNEPSEEYQAKKRES